MSPSPFTDTQDLLRQRRLERGLPAEAPQLASAQRLLLLGSSIGTGLLAVVLFGWGLICLRQQMVTAEIDRMSGIPGQLQTLESQLRIEKGKLDVVTKSNQGLARGLVAVSSGSALVSQLTQLIPQGAQITEATVSGNAVNLKGRSDDPGSFARVNAFSLLLAYAPLFKPDGVRVVKISREISSANGPAVSVVQSPAWVNWELTAGLAELKPADQLLILRKLGSDGMGERLQQLARMGLLQ
jgi:type IV pilus assembly protein PilN